MKKLLIFAIVSGVVSISEAGTVSVVGDSILSWWGQTKTYTIIYSGSPGITAFDVEIHLSNNNATASNWTIVATYRDTQFDWIRDPMTTPPDIGKAISACTADYMDLHPDPLNNTWITFTLTASSNGFVDITLEELGFFDTDWNEIHPTLGSLRVYSYVRDIPEPGTFLMLILGGLIAKKRRHLSI